MKHRVIAKVTRNDGRVFEDRTEHKTYGDAMHRYNELVHLIREREQMGEITDWELNIETVWGIA